MTPPPSPTVLTAIEAADTGGAWADAGFSVGAGRIHLGNLELVLSGPADRRGLIGWALDPAPGGPVDGLPVVALAADRLLDGVPMHPNTAVAVDHVVIGTPDLDRTSDALADLGWTPRRTAEIEGRGRRYRFYVVPTQSGKVVVEVVQPLDAADPTRPARFWGLAVTVADLDEAVAGLGPSRIGQPKDAVQPGRRIATVRGEALGISVPLVLMSPRVVRD